MRKLNVRLPISPKSPGIGGSSPRWQRPEAHTKWRGKDEEARRGVLDSPPRTHESDGGRRHASFQAVSPVPRPRFEEDTAEAGGRGEAGAGIDEKGTPLLLEEMQRMEEEMAERVLTNRLETERIKQEATEVRRERIISLLPPLLFLLCPSSLLLLLLCSSPAPPSLHPRPRSASRTRQFAARARTNASGSTAPASSAPTLQGCRRRRRVAPRAARRARRRPLACHRLLARHRPWARCSRRRPSTASRYARPCAAADLCSKPCTEA